MNSPYKLGLVLLVAVALSHSATAQDKPKGTPLAGADLNKLFAGGALLDYTFRPNSSRGAIILNPNGIAMVQWLNIGGTAGQETGTWRIAGETLCIKWKLLFDGADRCERHYRVADNAYESWDAGGKPVLAYRVRP